MSTCKNLKAGRFEIAHVLEWAEHTTDNLELFKEFGDKMVLCSLLNYRLFNEKGCDCIACGAKGTYFQLERTGRPGRSLYNNWHFNLYAVNSNGDAVLMTKDHTVPRSKGGTDEISNLQPMCARCNTKKGSSSMEVFQLNRPDIFKKKPIKKTDADFIFGKTPGKRGSYCTLTKTDYRNKALHVMKRLKERYGMELTETEYQDFIEFASKSGNMLLEISTNKSIRRVEWNGTTVFFVISKCDKMIYTVLDPNNVQSFYRQVPKWGETNEKKCLAMFDSIHETVEREFKTFDTEKETALYFQSCTYPRLMMMKWCKPGMQKEFDPGKFNIAVWKIIENEIKNKNHDIRSERPLQAVS